MTASFREIITDSIRYWEPRRLVYNGTLVIVVILTYIFAPVAERIKINVEAALGLFILAVVANILYCAAYLPDILLQYSDYGPRWKMYRIGLFALGTLLASVITFITVTSLHYHYH